ncbi:MAG: class I SAM-dependent methyltransferase [Planctomycetota bacterium]
MPPSTPQEEQQAQREYYKQTAEAYDQLHTEVYDEHHLALEYLAGLLPALGVTSALDVGCGTGRAMLGLDQTCPTVKTEGIEPVDSLIEIAQKTHGLSGDRLRVGSGDDLPYDDDAFDATMQFGVLHHVPDPSKVVAEMTRVARRVVILSDTNRFGQGRPWVRWIKLGLGKARLWKLYDRIRTGGKGYMESEADGLWYSYSVYDSYRQLGRWADRVIAVPIQVPKPRSHSWLGPLIDSSHVMLIAIRDRPAPHQSVS